MLEIQPVALNTPGPDGTAAWYGRAWRRLVGASVGGSERLAGDLWAGGGEELKGKA